MSASPPRVTRNSDTVEIGDRAGLARMVLLVGFTPCEFAVGKAASTWLSIALPIARLLATITSRTGPSPKRRRSRRRAKARDHSPSWNARFEPRCCQRRPTREIMLITLSGARWGLGDQGFAQGTTGLSCGVRLGSPSYRKLKRPSAFSGTMTRVKYTRSNSSASIA